MESSKLSVSGIWTGNVFTTWSTNGLICLANNDGDVTICNLSIRQHVSLPRTHPVRLSTSQNFASAVLGFDSISKKYKVFMSELRCIHGRGNKKHWVLTLGEDKSWREIISSAAVPNYPEITLHIDGVIYLINWTIKREIIAFNVGSEEFGTLPFPCELRHRILISPWIAVAGRLAAVTVNHQLSSLEIWGLEKSSMEWGKCMIPIPLEDREIMRKASSMDFTGKCNGEIVMLIQVGDTFLIFVFGTQRNLGMRTVQIAAETSRTSLWQVEMPKPKRLETSRSGSPVARRQTQMATCWRTGMARRRVVSFLVTTDSNSSQIKSNVAMLVLNAFLNSSSGKSGLLHCSHHALDRSFTHNLLWLCPCDGAPPLDPAA
nr:putative F-box protein At3g52320 [Ipomoea batatas]